MRSHSFQVPYLSLAKFALSFSQPRRSSSEPVVTQSVPDYQPNTLVGFQNRLVDVPSIQSAQPIQETERSPSPAPTEVDEPEPEAILEELRKLNIKVRDYAFPSSSSRTFQPAAEIFDPYKGIAEYEYRLRHTPDIPIPGRSMRRLLDVGWVSMDEAKERLRPIDWQEMNEYDARNTGHPWRPLKWSTVPTAEEREFHYNERASYLQAVDKYHAEQRLEEEWREMEKLRAKEARERAEQYLQENRERERKNMEARFAEETRISLDKQEGPAKGDDGDSSTLVHTTPTISSVSAGKKRALERSPSTPNFAVSTSTTDSSKRVKLSDETTSPATAGPSSQPHLMPPQPYQQYPAPLQAYDPRLYPDAASIIEAENRPPVVLPGQITPPASDDESDDRPNRLQKKKKGLRGLTRTKTFAQL